MKIIRDPLYDYISIPDTDGDWLRKLIDCPEVQRLRRIRQLGVSHFTYPGAEHNRLCHALGVLHLVQELLRSPSLAEKVQGDETKNLLMAAAVLHDVGHGPYSHVLEREIGKHEDWSSKTILDTGTGVNRVLSGLDSGFPARVASFFAETDQTIPRWQKSLISSQLDVDRMDYLRRDSLFTGAGYGKFDVFRLVNTMELAKWKEKELIAAWPDKSKYAIEEYIFARFYMYNAVYFHKTTRGYECLLRAIIRRAKDVFQETGRAPDETIPLLRPLIEGKELALQQYLDLEDHVICTQLALWRNSTDRILQDLSRRFLARRGFKEISKPEKSSFQLHEALGESEEHLEKAGLPRAYYLLGDAGHAMVYDKYRPEPKEEPTPATAIFLQPHPGKFVEISEALPRLGTITATTKSEDFERYYCPEEHKSKIEAILNA